MTGRRDCEAFRDDLDALRAGTAGPDRRDRVRRHARSCSGCAAELRLHEMVSLPPPDELERAVPDGLVASMWTRLGEASGRRSERDRAPRERRRAWLVPSMAAALVLLSLSTGFLAAERERLLEREAALTRLVATRGDGRPGVDGPEAISPPAVTTRWTMAHLERAWGDRRSVTIGELSDRLQRLAPATTLLDASDVAAALRLVPRPGSGLVREILEGIDATDGLQAGELLEAMRAPGLDPAASVPAWRILELLPASRAAGRS